ncbi:MAG: HNH endonuclease [Alphaproteobacteria bacterium]|nr:HNH endonuclease [Alphaproteobacteria bacterium]MBU1516732.1 HNH endonuclease [Alphaproteobacteria bacterium]MBU2096061.1 HNH endonuclease [Alphaproteobacteria bacterium]MBU2149737.1 HNH endonuclease [Alphaproteobacteria bacterium]MBU2307358.1 HNH endonuclease [Alphaproteobacteria bacterium]
MKAVFDTKPNSGYDDEIVRRYHFPTQRNYMDAARAAVGDWIVYREPQRNRGRRAYIAVARVLSIEPDPLRANHAYAVIGDYLPFDRPVPFAGPADGGGYWETPLRAVEDPSRVGATLQGKAMRPLADADFAAIVSAGLAETLAPDNAIRLGLTDLAAGMAEAARPFDHTGAAPGLDQVRRVEQMLVNRKIRDANFRRQVCEAYDDRCAVTGLRIINGGGRSEVQAAHIWGVGQGGPDVVQNGLALSGTVHWLFDRHLISLNEDYGLLVSHNKVPAELRILFERQLQRIHLPTDERLWPHPTYVEKHREGFMAA